MKRIFSIITAVLMLWCLSGCLAVGPGGGYPRPVYNNYWGGHPNWGWRGHGHWDRDHDHWNHGHWNH